MGSLFSLTKGKNFNLTIRVTIVCKFKDRRDKEVCLFARGVQRGLGLRGFNFSLIIGWNLFDDQSNYSNC